MTTSLIICLPGFPGFYESHLSGLIDNEIEQAFECNGEDVSEKIDYGATFEAISKVWVDVLNDELGTSFVFHELWSPKEYNFITDRVMVEVADSKDIERLRAYHGSAECGRLIAEHMKQRPGFFPHWDDDPNHEDWARPIEEWKGAQLSILLEALIEAELCDIEDLCHTLMSGRLNHKFWEAIVYKQ